MNVAELIEVLKELPGVWDVLTPHVSLDTYNNYMVLGSPKMIVENGSIIITNRDNIQRVKNEYGGVTLEEYNAAK